MNILRLSFILYVLKLSAGTGFKKKKVREITCFKTLIFIKIKIYLHVLSLQLHGPTSVHISVLRFNYRLKCILTAFSAYFLTPCVF